MLVLLLGLMFYRHSVFHLGLYNASWRPVFGGWAASDVTFCGEVFTWIVWAYAVVLFPFYVLGDGAKSKALVVVEYVVECACVGKFRGLSEVEHQAVLTLLVKFLFLPFCVNGLWSHAAILNGQVLGLLEHGFSGTWFDLYNGRLHALILNVIFVFDFVPFVVGYLVECEAFGNVIKRVDSSLLGWVVCLACYPPFNQAAGVFLTWHSEEYARAFPLFPAWVHMGLNLLLVALFGLYAYASVCLGFKCSNLTARGVVCRGIYGVVRHPAYVLKNAAWWIAGVPVFYAMWLRSVEELIWSVAALAAWTGVYALRALTEERNLMAVDGQYRRYCKRVPYRFIPGVI